MNLFEIKWGDARKDNLEKLKENGYDYVCVARDKPVELSEINKKGMVIVKEDKFIMEYYSQNDVKSYSCYHIFYHKRGQRHSY